MIVKFDKKYLQELYAYGWCNEKKHRFQADIVIRYKRCIDVLRQVGKVEELFLFPSMRYEVLKGDKAGLSSIRVNNRYRIEFYITETEGEPMMTVCNVQELSNHYK